MNCLFCNKQCIGKNNVCQDCSTSGQEYYCKETYNTNPDEKKSTKFDPHDFPKEEKEEVKTVTDEQKQYQILLNIASTGTSEELFNYIHSIELEAKKEAKQEFEQKLNQAIIELREKIIKN